MIPTPGKLRKRIGILNSDINRIDLKEVLFPKKITKTIEIENPTENELVLSILNSPEYISVKISPKILKPKKRGKLTLTFNSKHKKIYGNSTDHVKVNIKAGKKNITGTITVNANMVEDFSKLTEKELADAPVIYFPKNRFNLGEFKLNDSKRAEFLFENRGKSDLKVHNIEISNNLFKLKHFDPVIKPGERGKIIVTVKPKNETSNMKSNIFVISNDPHNNSARLLVQGSIKKEYPKLSTENKELMISEKETYEMMKEYKGKDKLVILDLRSEKEFNLSHIPEAKY